MIVLRILSSISRLACFAGGAIVLLIALTGCTTSAVQAPAGNGAASSLSASALPAPGATVDDPQSPCYNANQALAVQPLANAPKQFAAPAQVIDPSHTYCAFMTTDHGVIVVEMYARLAPKHVNNLVFLANEGFYDNITWHRVITGFVAQTGDPLATGGGGPGYTIPLEVNPALKYDRAGMLGMARTSDPNSAGSQFFITYGPLQNLDPSAQSQGYTIFGRVVKGMNVALQIKPRDQGDPPGDRLVSIRTLDVTAVKQ